MIVAAIVFSVCQFLVCLSFAVLVRWYVARKETQYRQEIQDLVRSFIEPPDENTPSALGVLLDQGATLLASRLVQQLKAMLAGVESGLAKQEQAAMLGEISSSSPMIGLLANILPKKIRAGLMKNPQMIGALSKMVNRNGGSDGSGSPAPLPRRHRD